MANIDIATTTHNRLVEAGKAVRAYAGSDASTHAIEMLDALAASYCLDLVHVLPEGLVRVQAALQQVQALRNVFADDGYDMPKI